MNMKKIFVVGLIVFSSVLTPTSFLVAAGAVGGTTPSAPQVSMKLQNPLKDELNTFPKFVAVITKTAVQILFPFIVLGFIYSGFLFVKAQGNPAGLEEAKTAITYSMLGAFILMGAFAFAQIIGKTISTITK